VKPRVLRPEAAARYLGLSKATIYRLEKEGSLRPRILLGPRSSAWLISDLDDFLASRPHAAAGFGRAT
jgi:predicted DNA-binding transcriptional regulator AlpA